MKPEWRPAARDAAIEALPDAVVVLDARGRVVDRNPAACRLPGLGEALVVGQPIGGLPASAADLLRRLAEPGDGRVEVELPGGADTRSYEVQVRAVSDGIEGRRGQLLLFHDVTEAKRAARLRDDLTHTMVHDLKSPLLSIDGAVALLAESAAALPESQRRLLQMARRNTERMTNLLEGILDLIRLESGELPLQKRATPVLDLVQDVVERQRVVAEPRRLRLEVDVSRDLPLALVDPELIGRVLQNLIGNAVKFVPEGGRIRVEARRAEEMIVVEVADDGPGLPASLAGRVFEKFATGPQRERGSGLGLAFCRLAVEAHGGRIRAASAPGATFTLSLPVASQDSPAPAPGAPSRSAGEGGRGPCHQGGMVATGRIS